MRIKNVKLEYNVFRYDWNSRGLKKYNILANLDIKEINKKVLKKEIDSFDKLKEYVDKDLKYYYHSRSECEMVVGDLSLREDSFTKIDMYAFAKINLDLIVRYIINEMRIEF